MNLRPTIGKRKAKLGIWLAAVAGFVFLLATGVLSARDIEADPQADYSVRPEAGQWMILAASFTGPNAAQLAQDMALEVRRDYKQPAWVFNHGGEERKKQMERLAEIREQFNKVGGGTGGKVGPLVRGVRIQEQYAVLIGGYKDMESARKDLDRIKKLPRPADKFCNVVAVAGPSPDKSAKGMVQRAYENPFERGFVVRNPTVPKETPASNAPDPFLKELNADEPLSLLKCRKGWTLVIKDFPGPAVVQSAGGNSTFLQKLGLTSKSADLLNANALQAREVARVLREHPDLKFDSYVLHTRHASFVTVGTFDGPDDPRMTEVKFRLAKVASFQLKGMPEGPMKLWAQPLPMEVPKF